MHVYKGRHDGEAMGINEFRFFQKIVFVQGGACKHGCRFGIIALSQKNAVNFVVSNNQTSGAVQMAVYETGVKNDKDF